ncbi:MULTISPECIES: hypothetical protein [unclassified Endozoicomonas]|uniref:hypothetical protein n=1 Tax=unclassified Endozoicomonas TaxID=2644528 RepID=UPI003BB77354
MILVLVSIQKPYMKFSLTSESNPYATGTPAPPIVQGHILLHPAQAIFVKHPTLIKFVFYTNNLRQGYKTPAIVPFSFFQPKKTPA